MKDGDITVEDLVKQTIGKLGENMRIGRFVTAEARRGVQVGLLLRGVVHEQGA